MSLEGNKLHTNPSKDLWPHLCYYITMKKKMKSRFLSHLDKKHNLYKRNANNTHFNTYFLTHSLWLIKIHMCSTKLIWVPHDLVGPTWILTNQKKYIKKYVLKYLLLVFLIFINIQRDKLVNH